jgi:pimeloyl-ACP methyl ester carboxylesterase
MLKRVSAACGLLLLALSAGPASADCVILLHGLARTSASMEELAAAFAEAGYAVANIDYPSRRHPVETLAPLVVQAGLAACPADTPVHFVTHSLGGILVRHYLASEPLPRLGRVVMIAPPNQGSEVVDRLGAMPGFAFWNGPAGLQLGTGPDALPRKLPAVTYPTGVIAGTRTFNLLLSQFLPNPDDGKVSVHSARVEGMRDFITVPYSHPFIMEREEVVTLALRFLSTGSFAEVVNQPEGGD